MAFHNRHPTNRRSRPRPRGPWKHGPIPVVGLIGAIGAGKSLVAALLAERGAFVLDADAVGHALLTQTPVREQVVDRFGPAILAPTDGAEGPSAIDRRALGAIVFAQPEALRALESIVHPRMRKTFERAIARAVRRGESRAVVLDAAILLEAGWDSLCDRILCVDAPRDQRLSRLSAQRGWTDQQLTLREKSQRPIEEKRGRADAVLTNDAGPEALGKAAEVLWGQMLAPPRRAPSSVERPAGARVRPRTESSDATGKI